MKKILTHLVLIIGGCLSIQYAKAQAPQAMSYQAVARDNAGNLLASQNISLRFTIHDSTTTGSILYRETHTTVSNNLGLVTVNIGQGSPVSGTFNSINWAQNSKFLQVEMDASGQSNYTDMGTQQMMSVPFAFFAERSNVPNGTSAGQVLIWNGTKWTTGTVCSLLNSDPNNCGTCNHVCTSPANGTTACVNGVCVITCNPGFVNCNGVCRTLNNDPNNCGSCGVVCTNPNGTTACVSGACIPICNTGYADCDGNSSNGCETNKQTNVNNCGNCGMVCPTRANAITSCVNGICGFICNTGFANCNGLAADGCEVNLLTNPSNCGTCGHACTVGQSCVNGNCQ